MDNFGLIFHWGVYSVPAYDDVNSAKRRKIQNGSEWYLDRLTKKFRVTKGDLKTQEFHQSNYAQFNYQDFADSLTAENWQPDDWMKLAKSVGATYVILTAKHHDGFCLWSTKTSPKWNSVEVGPKRDLVGEFAQSARKAGLKFGVYYSWLVFNRGFSQKYLNQIVLPQIDELLSYKPDIWWFDGDWIATVEQWHSREIVNKIHKVTPNALINNRLGKGLENALVEGLSKDGIEVNLDSLIGDYTNFSDRYIPLNMPDIPWEHINTIGLSWGFNAEQTESDYKTGQQLFDLYTQVTALNGRFLLNLGPTADGTLDPIEVKRLNQLAKLM